MTRFQRAGREALGITICAVVLGLVTTGIREKGIFQSQTDQAFTGSALVGPVMIHLPEAKDLYESGKALFLDARHAFEFDQGHIKGAVSLPLNEFDQRTELVHSLPKEKTLITYCDGVECNSSIGLAAKLREAGFSGVRIFFAGWNEWQKQNLPTEVTPK